MMNAILDLLFPKNCFGCGVPGVYVCEKCLKNLAINKTQSCPNCRRRNAFGIFCGRKCSRGFYFNQLIVCLDYGTLLRKLIIMFKYKFSTELIEVLGRIMVRQINLVSGVKILLVPVPLHKNRLRYRGFNQAMLLAQYLAKQYEHLEVCDCLIRSIYKKEQAKLGKCERLVNLKNTISIRDKMVVKDKIVILIDDVATTCSTLNECSRALKEGGAKYVCGLVLARS